MHTIRLSISHTRYFNTQKDMAEFLGIKNGSKKAISKECGKWGYGVEFDEYWGEYNLECII